MHPTCHHNMYTLDRVPFIGIIKGEALTIGDLYHPAALAHSLEIHKDTHPVTEALLISSCRSYHLAKWRSLRYSLYYCLSLGRCRWPLARRSGVSSAKGVADAAACVCRRSCAQVAQRSAVAYRRAPAALGVATSRHSAAGRMGFEASWYEGATVVKAMILVVSVTTLQGSFAAAATTSLAAKWIDISFVLAIGCCCSCNVPWSGFPPFSFRWMCEETLLG